MEHPATAIYDANVLYPAPLRDLFVRLAQAGLVRARWTDAIHDEWVRNVQADNPSLSPERLSRTRALMNDAVRDCLVTGYEDLIDTSACRILTTGTSSLPRSELTPRSSSPSTSRTFPPTCWPGTTSRRSTRTTSCSRCLTPPPGRFVRRSNDSGPGFTIHRSQPGSFWPRSKAKGLSRRSPDSGRSPKCCEAGE